MDEYNVLGWPKVLSIIERRIHPLKINKTPGSRWSSFIATSSNERKILLMNVTMMCGHHGLFTVTAPAGANLSCLVARKIAQLDEATKHLGYRIDQKSVVIFDDTHAIRHIELHEAAAANPATADDPKCALQ